MEAFSKSAWFCFTQRSTKGAMGAKEPLRLCYLCTSLRERKAIGNVLMIIMQELMNMNYFIGAFILLKEITIYFYASKIFSETNRYVHGWLCAGKCGVRLHIK